MRASVRACVRVSVRECACTSVHARVGVHDCAFTSGREQVCIHECEWTTVCARVRVSSVRA